MHKFLIIQTAFTGDVVLATALIERLHQRFPAGQIDFLLRRGNEGLLTDHPYLTNLLVWNKQDKKLANLAKIIQQVRRAKYTHVINIHRFASSGLITLFSGAGYKVGFDKNPLSFGFDKKVAHIISEPYSEKFIHEVERNQLLIADFSGDDAAMPRLYPSKADEDAVKSYTATPYICVAPSSVWFTKQFPVEKWIELANELPKKYKIFVLGGPGDKELGSEIALKSTHPSITNLCGTLTFLQSAALMRDAEMNYTNDSAPLHFSSAMNARVTGVFCSTVPAFGFGPLGKNGKIVEVAERLYCRPCGLHGHRACPEGHFKCAKHITNEQLLWWISKTT